MRSLLRWATISVAFLALPATGRAQESFFDSKGVRLRYVDQGRGQPVVLVHGLGNSLELWTTTGVLPELAKSYRVIAFDSRGQGRSEKPHDPNAYGAELALDIVRLLDHLGIDRAHVIGFSNGANITSQLLTLRPDRFLTAVLLGGAGRWEWTPEDARLAEQIASELERDCVSRTMISRVGGTNASQPSEEDLRARSKACFADSSHDRFATAAIVRSRRNQVVSAAKVSSVRVPTLAIVGELDSNLEYVQQLKKLRPDINLLVIKGATHAGERGVLRQTDTIRAIRAFLASHQ